MTYRNRALLDLCHEAPCLLLPGQHQCTGPSEPAHSDMIRHGRGKDHKSHDCFAVPGCPVCHEHFKRSELGPDGYHQAWTAAMERWILYLWVSEKIRLTDINQRPKELSMEAPMCKICEHRHYVRDPHQFGKNTSADEAKDRKVGNARRDSSADCWSSRITAQAGGTPAKNSQLSAKQSSKLIRREGALKYAGGSANAVIAAGALFAPMGESPERTPGANRAQNGVTARRDGKNTRGEGRRVLKAEAGRPDATRTASTEKSQPKPATQSTGKRGKPEKPAPGKRKTGPKATKRRKPK